MLVVKNLSERIDLGQVLDSVQPDEHYIIVDEHFIIMKSSVILATTSSKDGYDFHDTAANYEAHLGCAYHMTAHS